MKVIGLDGKEYSWKITRYSNESQNCSNLHLQTRLLLKTIYPYDIICEEITIPGTKTEINNKALILDFYIHFHRLAIEVQGEQHYKFNRFFYTNKLEHFRAKKLDQLKEKWCIINNIKLIKLSYNDINNWENIIKEK